MLLGVDELDVVESCSEHPKVFKAPDRSEALLVQSHGEAAPSQGHFS